MVLVRDPFYIVDVVTIIEPVVGALTFGDDLRNVLAHLAQLLFARLALLNRSTVAAWHNLSPPFLKVRRTFSQPLETCDRRLLLLCLLQ